MAHAQEYPTSRGTPNYSTPYTTASNAPPPPPPQPPSSAGDASRTLSPGESAAGYYANGKRLSSIPPPPSLSPGPPPQPPPHHHLGIKRKPVKRVPVHSPSPEPPVSTGGASLSPSGSASSGGGAGGFHTPPISIEQQQQHLQYYNNNSNNNRPPPQPQQPPPPPPPPHVVNNELESTFPVQPPSPNPYIKQRNEPQQQLQPQPQPHRQPSMEFMQQHDRSGSIHSVSSSTSLSQQPLYMKSSGAPPPMIRTTAPQTQPQTQEPPAASGSHQYSMSHSSIYSASSRQSNQGDAELGVGTGSNYVKEMRKKSGTVWCDVSSKVWGLPIGIAGKTAGSYSALAPSKGYLRKAMDIRHSHLAPRLLASEVEDEDDDDLPTQSPVETASISKGGLAHSSGGSVSTVRTPTMDQASVASTGSHENTTNAQNKPRERANSDSSTKSVEEEVGKIRLFVANPDTDDD